MILQIGAGQQGSIGTILSGIKRLFDPEGARRQDLLEEVNADPRLGARLAQAGRNQIEAFSRNAGVLDADSVFRQQTPEEQEGKPEGRLGNPFAPILASIGLNPDDQKNIDFLSALVAANPESFKQAIDEQLVREPGAIEGAAGATTARNVAAAKTSRAVGAEAENLEEQARILGEIGGPRALAERQKRGAEQATQLADLAIGLGEFSAEIREGAFADYQRYLADNPALRGLAGASFTNPVFVRALSEMARLKLTEKLARIRATAATTVDRVRQAAALFSANAQYRQAVEDRAALRESGGTDEEIRAMDASINGQTAVIEDFGLGRYFPSVIAIDGELVVIQPPLGRPPGGGDPENLSEARLAGEQENIIAEGKAVFVAIANEDGMDEVMRLLYSNPPEEILEFRTVMEERGELFDFLEKTRRQSPEGREAALRDPSSLLGGFPLP